MKTTLIAVTISFLSSNVFAADIIIKCGASVDVQKQSLTGPRSFAVTDDRISPIKTTNSAAKIIDLSD